MYVNPIYIPQYPKSRDITKLLNLIYTLKGVGPIYKANNFRVVDNTSRYSTCIYQMIKFVAGHLILFFCFEEFMCLFALKWVKVHTTFYETSLSKTHYK